MLMLPCVLGEFRTATRGEETAKQIIGLPEAPQQRTAGHVNSGLGPSGAKPQQSSESSAQEHITSDIGSVGDFAAGSEVAFGTILQRTYSVLGARMHYGHPDIMNKQYMMQQGGVSKATKTINLSEDIFAGMDFTLRGQGRSIKHCEYFHVAKGRDLGFNTVLGFFSKHLGCGGCPVSATGWVAVLRLTFYYAHVGFYVTQGLVSASMPILVAWFTWGTSWMGPGEPRAIIWMASWLSFAEVFAWTVRIPGTLGGLQLSIFSLVTKDPGRMSRDVSVSRQ
eukprot:Skav213133  [mRNA]  locus=scaffold107:318311:322688:+ [translate_table: standard]